MILSSPGEININSHHPYLNCGMFQLWESSKVTDLQSGWEPIYFQQDESFTYAYIKSHSNGEYIFDWAWADLYQRFNQPYYPKLIQALPVTPISAPKFINGNEPIYEEVFDYYQKEPLSSHHILFSEEQEQEYFLNKDYFHQQTLQFHFINKFESYDDFMSHLKSRKRKNILKERNAVQDYKLRIEKVPAIDLSIQDRETIYHLYLSTIMKKFSQAYLTKDFFIQLNQGFYYLAYRNDELIAMSLFFEGDSILYGRYWGIHPKYESEYNYLHFEMCYYLGIERTIDLGYKRFEAGAQGEQKLLRGFTPVAINSLHHIKHPQFSIAIKDFVRRQNEAYNFEIERLKDYLPFNKK